MAKKERGRPACALTEQQIRRALSVTRSCTAAARVLGVHYDTFKMYAKLFIDKDTGKNLFELHKNQTGKGIRKVYTNTKEPVLSELLVEGVNVTSYSIDKLKHRLIFEGLLYNECCKCGFKEYRVTDYKVPLLLNYKDKNKTNWTLSNLELVCYNCYFLKVGDVFDDQQVAKIEDFGSPTIAKSREVDWELDDYYKKHFEELGLGDDDTENDGSEYIARL